MASVLTYNQIIELLTDIARRHFQLIIQLFGFPVTIDRAQLRLLMKRLDSIEAKLDMRCNCCAICNTTPCDAGLHG